MVKSRVLKEYSIIIPLHDNNGSAFPVEMIDELRTQLVSAFGGCTRQDGLTGYWRDSDGILYEDIGCSFTVATGARDAQAQVVSIAKRWCVTLSQLAMYVRLPGGKAIIVHPDS